MSDKKFEKWYNSKYGYMDIEREKGHGMLYSWFAMIFLLTIMIILFPLIWWSNNQKAIVRFLWYD